MNAGSYLLCELVAEGLHGWGEVTTDEGPFYDSETTDTAWHIISDFIAPLLAGKTLVAGSQFPEIVARIRGHEMAKAGVENAIWDLEAQMKEILSRSSLAALAREIACGVSLGIRENPQALLKKVEEELGSGYQRIKIKIKPGQDLEFVAAVRKISRVTLSVDANAAYRLGMRQHCSTAR